MREFKLFFELAVIVFLYFKALNLLKLKKYSVGFNG